jgi:tetratricopeptide (TPR) repeat protein
LFPSRHQPWFLGLLLFLLVTGVFLPALNYDFICYDDPNFVFANPHVHDGLTWPDIKWAFLSADIDYWRPLSWLSHMVDVQVFGLDPWGHHLTNVLLHAFNSLLVFAVLRKMTGAVWRSLLVAALFGLHPLHVESVVWIAERKDVLCSLFWLLTLWAYGHWVWARSARRPNAAIFYGLTLVCFAFGLMTKPMAVTIPCVLLLLDFWPLDRFGRDSRRPPAAVARSLLIEKAPFFALAGVVGVATVIAQKQVGALKPASGYPWPDRISNALAAYNQYLGRCFFPSKLAVFYPYVFGQSPGKTLLAGAVLGCITIAVCVCFKRRPYLPMGWFWFLATLLPVIGLIQVGEQSTADRYTYMPLVGIFIMVAWTAGEVAVRRPRWSAMLAATAGAIVVCCAALTAQQLTFWQDSTTLFRRALAVTKDNSEAHTNLGFALAQSPAHLSEAIAEYREGLRIDPNVAETHNYLAFALTRTPGHRTEAIAEFRTALRLDPKLSDAHNNLAISLETMPELLPEAVGEFKAALQRNPGSAEIHRNLGIALMQLPGRLDEAISELRMALRLTPGWAAAHLALGRALAQKAALPEAVAEFRTALGIAPYNAEAHFTLARALAQMPDKLTEAIAEYEAAIRLRADYAQAHFGLGGLLAALPGQMPRAIAEYEAAVRADPDLVEAHFNLGFALAEIPGRLPEAIAEYQAAVRAKPDFAEAHNNLADALRRTPGRSAEAIAEYEAAIRADPDYFDAHFNLGLLLSDIPERRADAIAHFAAALRVRPDCAPARAMLERLDAAPR